METKVPYHKWFVIDGQTMAMRVCTGLVYKSSDFGGDSGVALGLVFVPCTTTESYHALVSYAEGHTGELAEK